MVTITRQVLISIFHTEHFSSALTFDMGYEKYMSFFGDIKISKSLKKKFKTQMGSFNNILTMYDKIVPSLLHRVSNLCFQDDATQNKLE